MFTLRRITEKVMIYLFPNFIFLKYIYASEKKKKKKKKKEVLSIEGFVTESKICLIFCYQMRLHIYTSYSGDNFYA